MLVTLSESDLEALIRRVLSIKPPEPLLYTMQEAAQKLNVKPEWLAYRVRKGEVPYRKPGHRVYFSPEDLKQIVEKWKVGGVSRDEKKGD